MNRMRIPVNVIIWSRASTSALNLVIDTFGLDRSWRRSGVTAVDPLAPDPLIRQQAPDQAIAPT